MIELGDFRLDVINDGLFEDDADTFVQNCVERQSTAGVTFRGKSRIKVGFNSLLIRGRGHTIVVDPGTGDKPRDALVSRYKMEWPRKFSAALRELGVRPENVDIVILTHLHWDHCGGTTRLNGQGIPVPVFERAAHYVQKREWEAANEAVLLNDDSYAPADFQPLQQAGLLQLVDGDALIAPGITARWVGGHSRGLQVVTIGDGDSPHAIYLSDLVPTTTQIPLDCGLSYDIDGEELRASKQRILTEAAARHDLLLFVHAPRVRAGYLERSGPDYKLNSINP